MAEELRDIGPLRSLLSHRPLALLSDIDGTLAPIVDNPEDARVSPPAREHLGSLIREGVGVAFITGRALEKARAMVDVPGALFAANHGLSLLLEGEPETPEEVRPYVDHARQVLADVGSIDVPGVIIEDKGPVIAFHYRMAADEHAAVNAITVAINRSSVTREFRIHRGRKVIELRPPLPIDKGTAAGVLARRMAAAAIICLGDDATDLDMFESVRSLRGGGLPAANVGVWSPEMPPEVMEAADYLLQGVEGVEWLLGELVTALRRKAPAGP